MPVAPSSVPSPTRERLRVLAQLLHDAADHDPDLVPFAVGVRTADGDVELAVRPCLGDHPVDDLLGLRAPADWWAFGLVTAGRAHPLPGHAEHAPPDVPRLDGPTRMRMVHLVPRRGPSLSLLHLASGESLELGTPHPEGRVADACFRVMGRRTAPARSSPQSLAEWVWLDRLLRTVIEDGCTHPPRALIDALHPRSAAAPRSTGGADTVRQGGLEAVARLGAAARWAPGWRSWRRALARHDEAVLGVTPETAQWMDDGMFARWVAGELPPLEGLADDLALLVPPAVVREVLGVLRAHRRR